MNKAQEVPSPNNAAFPFHPISTCLDFRHPGKASTTYLFFCPSSLQANPKGLAPLVAWGTRQAVEAGVGVDTAGSFVS